jgi:hypothetical protein
MTYITYIIWGGRLNIKIQKIIIITIISLLVSTSFSTSFAFQKDKNNNSSQYDLINRVNNETVATCYFFNHDGIISKDKLISYKTGTYLVKLFKESNNDTLKRTELINALYNLEFINDKSFNIEKPRCYNNINPFKLSSTGTSFFCSIASAGTGRITPPVLLPRPRGILLWTGYEDPEFAITSVGSLLINKGFFAYGSQHGIAIGFIGLGMTYGTPVGTVYGFTGYALYTSVTATSIDFYPPNSKPIISNPVPSDSQENIPTTITELSFQIHDEDIDLMDYSVNTDPYIGSGSKNNVVNGIYSISVDGLQPSTTYTWTVTVTDGEDTTEKVFTFTTVPLEPLVTDPYPQNGTIFIPVDLTKLSFKLSDPQGDLMDYTIETSPFIGYDSASGVDNGTYSLVISNLDRNTYYKWYVNVTDGTYWTKKIFNFFTRYTSDAVRYDDFEDYKIGGLPKAERGWSTSGITQNQYIEACVDPLDPDNMVMKIHGSSSVYEYYCRLHQKNFGPSGDYIIHYRIYTPELSMSKTIYEHVYENRNDTALACIHRRSGQIRWGGSNCDDDNYYEFSPQIDPTNSRWMEEEIRVTPSELQLYHDDSIDAVGGYCMNPINGANYWSISAFRKETQSFYIDDFWIIEYSSEK